ncbi:MAG: 3-hydroxyacyl-CoA dehydrogenase [Eubacterium sp.]|nr:3-hydroxyacyl-CoA dehydrogenase [Eubacterium sp.]
MRFQKVGVVGAGNIGSGVIQDLAQTGHHVIAVDLSQEALERSEKSIQQNVLLYRLYGTGKKAIQDPGKVIKNIEFTDDYSKLENASFIIENVTENQEVKNKVHKRINEIVKEDAIVAVNSSCILITSLASNSKNPEKYIGMHFMNPVPVMPVVEVIKGFHTSEETIEDAKTLLRQMDKDAVLIEDMPGFVSNRVMTFMMNEAAFLVQEKVAPVEEIDRLFKTCYGHKMGPLETIDLIGVDTILYSMEVLYESFNDSKYRPCPLLRKMANAGLKGRKSGQGFYKY